MTLDEIRRAVNHIHGIGELNAMQSAVAASKARRIVLLAPTGTGKTLAFACALLQRIEAGVAGNSPQAVVIAPSRELVRQICDVIRPLGAVAGLKTAALYGGNSFADEASSLSSRMPDIVVATPGRLLDHIERSTVSLASTSILVLDEYDKTLALGFHEQMRKIMRQIGTMLPHGQPRFALVSSATEIEAMPDFFTLGDAETIDFRADRHNVRRLRVVNVPSPGRDKLETLAALLRAVHSAGRALVFVNHRESADRVGKYLTAQRISNVVYHGGMDQQSRELALAVFESHAATVMVATDLAARGLDISNVASIIHYHPASDAETWTHRNGRTGRGDEAGGDIYMITAPDENLADFIDFDHDSYPDLTAEGAISSPYVSVYFDRGKRDKISRGDIAGFIIKQAGVAPERIGKIAVGANYAVAAVDPADVESVIEASRRARLKNVRIRASLLRDLR